MQNCVMKTTEYVYFNPRHRNLNLMSGVFFLLKLFLSNILKLKTQAIGISHTGTDFCCVYRV